MLPLHVLYTIWMFFMHPQAIHSGGYYVFTVSRCLSHCSNVQCQYGLIHRVDESITHIGKNSLSVLHGPLVNIG